jgi:hypothetical protein
MWFDDSTRLGDSGNFLSIKQLQLLILLIDIYIFLKYNTLHDNISVPHWTIPPLDKHAHNAYHVMIREMYA